MEPDVSAVRLHKINKGTFLNFATDKHAHTNITKGKVWVKVRISTGSANMAEMSQSNGIFTIKMGSDQMFEIQIQQQSGTTKGGWKPAAGSSNGWSSVQPRQAGYDDMVELNRLVRLHLRTNAGKFCVFTWSDLQ